MTSSDSNAWTNMPESWDVSSRFDGGDTGCGEMLLDLRNHVRNLEPGTYLAVRALDAGAPIEIPSWCRLTGHRLVEVRHPFYLTEVKPRESASAGT